jgi:hypothetical protein
VQKPFSFFCHNLLKTQAAIMKKCVNFSLMLIFLSLISSIAIFNNLLGNGDTLKLKEPTCGRFPQEENIFIDNVVWQVLETPFGFIHMLNAYLDARWNRNIVRINVIAPQLNITAHKLFCQFWFDKKSQPLVVEASEFQTMWFNSEKLSICKYFLNN